MLTGGAAAVNVKLRDRGLYADNLCMITIYVKAKSSIFEYISIYLYLYSLLESGGLMLFSVNSVIGDRDHEKCKECGRKKAEYQCPGKS